MRSDNGSSMAISPVIGTVLMVAVVVILVVLLANLGFNVSDITGERNPTAAVSVDEVVNNSYSRNNSGTYYDVRFVYTKAVNSDKVLIRDSDFGAGANLTRTGQVKTLTKREGAVIVVIAVKEGDRRVLRDYVVGGS